MSDVGKAVLVLEDGQVFDGQAYGTTGATTGEIVFNTGMTGYQETLTDPSYYRQIVVFTAPHIGNIGMNDEDVESAKIWVSGLVVRDPARIPSNWRSTRSLDHDLVESEIIGISGLDTRQLTRVLRDSGVMRGGIFSGEGLATVEEMLERVRSSPRMEGAHLVDDVSTKEAYEVLPEPGVEVLAHVVAVDLGAKAMSPTLMARRGIWVTVVPSTATFDEVLAATPDGVFFSNGPGDPGAAVHQVELA
ncbi:MAG: carbamoyl phosphate synthase small subunit, partial [Demequinaceae bacterium]|nr:carbamoyl phosphate synthase small subunit [Demequinaceae bacterium]